MRVFLVVHVDVHLGALESAVKFFDICFVDVLFDDCRNHEGAIENLPEPQLFREVHHAAEQRGRLNLPVNQQLEALKDHAAEMKFDFFSSDYRLQRLERRVMTSRLVSDSDWNAGKI